MENGCIGMDVDELNSSQSHTRTNQDINVHFFNSTC